LFVHTISGEQQVFFMGRLFLS